jgi:ADP-ribose pyrophosphatase YjhB (NUDIX family)
MPKILEIKGQPYNDPVKLLKASRGKTIPGYPPASERLVFSQSKWQQMVLDTCIELPEGPWHLDLSNRYSAKAKGKTDRIVTPDNPATAEQLARWKSIKGPRTNLGLILHPLAELAFTTVLQDGSNIGMFTGPGRLWRYGPDLTSNLAVRRVYKGQVEYLTVATTARANKLVWSLPGGHAEPGQNAYDAAYDEGEQETGLPKELVAGLSGLMVETVPSMFGPNTAVAWLDERYLMLNGEGDSDLLRFVPKPIDTDEVVNSRWMPLDEMRAIKNFMGSHLKEVNAFESALAER